jgi:hypothetical protein
MSRRTLAALDPLQAFRVPINAREVTQTVTGIYCLRALRLC